MKAVRGKPIIFAAILAVVLVGKATGQDANNWSVDRTPRQTPGIVSSPAMPQAVTRPEQTAVAPPSTPKPPAVIQSETAPYPTSAPLAPGVANAPALPSGGDQPSGTSVVLPARPAYYEAGITPQPPSTNEVVVPRNNYGPDTPSGNRVDTTPLIGYGSPTPRATNPWVAPVANAPQPPTCDKRCY